MPTGGKPARQNLVKRACDACKVRKIKCSEESPCRGCTTSGIACTFNKLQSTRGPRSLRAKTIRKISQQQSAHDVQSSDTSDQAACCASVAAYDAESGPCHTLDSVVHLLRIYHRRLYPIWPIVDVDELANSIANRTATSHMNSLASAMCVATIAQLKLDLAFDGHVPNKGIESPDDSPSLTCLRTAFFLHIFHENQTPGGASSLLHLREAITLAQMMRLDRESSYGLAPEDEQELRRRILWLLFITERGVAMLHKMPVVLKPNIMFPSLGGNDQAHVLPAFLKLVNLFYVFDQSGIFEILQNSDTDLYNTEDRARGCLEVLQRSLQESPVELELSNDVQRADICVTRQWMRAILWRAATRLGVSTPGISPVSIAKEFLAFVSQLPKAAIEAHGPTLEIKTYEIATTVIDAVIRNSTLSDTDQPREILYGLQQILSSSRGGNQALLASLYSKMAMLPLGPPLVLSPSTRILELGEDGAFAAPEMSSVSPLFNTLPSAWTDLEAMLASTELFRMSRAPSPNYNSIDQQQQQMSWPPLDFSTPLIRSPSPLTYGEARATGSGSPDPQLWKGKD